MPLEIRVSIYIKYRTSSVPDNQKAWYIDCIWSNIHVSKRKEKRKSVSPNASEENANLTRQFLTDEAGRVLDGHAILVESQPLDMRVS